MKAQLYRFQQHFFPSDKNIINNNNKNPNQKRKYSTTIKKYLKYE